MIAHHLQYISCYYNILINHCLITLPDQYVLNNAEGTETQKIEFMEAQGKNMFYDHIEGIIKTSNINTTGNGSGNYESPSYWNQYSKIGITELLELRIKDLGVLEKVKLLTSDVVWSGDREKGNILVKTIIEFLAHEERIAVMPLNLYYKHWVGMVIRKDDHGMSLTYLDSEITPFQ